MLIYLIIAAEIAIIYTVFWYIYIREPKPYRVTGHPWGKYGKAHITTGGDEVTIPVRYQK